jgi:hypothetical protein
VEEQTDAGGPTMPARCRLQVVFDAKELRELRRLAKQRDMTLSEWVRQALREARRRGPVEDQARKLAAIRDATQHAFPAPDIDAMLEEIERCWPVHPTSASS